jgi:hypothetical protein
VRPPWGTVRMEHLRVHCPCNHPGRLACCNIPTYRIQGRGSFKYVIYILVL